MNVLDLDGGLVDEHSHGERQPAQRHDVDGLARGPQENHGGEQGKRDIGDDDERAAPVAEEDQHHQTSQSRAEQSLDNQAADGVRDERRLIEFEAHIDIVGDHLLEVRDCCFDGVDDGKRGGVGALGDGNVDGPLAVDVGVGGDEIGAVLDGADVAQEDGRAGDRADGGGEQLGKIAAQSRVGAGDALDVAGPHVARRHHERGFADGGNGLFGRDLVLPELVGIEHDDDGALVSAEGRRRGNAGERRKQRPHTVQREILHLGLRAGGAAEDQHADGDASGIETRDEGRHRSRRHEGAGAVHIPDSLGHRLTHVSALMEH